MDSVSALRDLVCLLFWTYCISSSGGVQSFYLQDYIGATNVIRIWVDLCLSDSLYIISEYIGVIGFRDIDDDHRDLLFVCDYTVAVGVIVLLIREGTQFHVYGESGIMLFALFADVDHLVWELFVCANVGSNMGESAINGGWEDFSGTTEYHDGAISGEEYETDGGTLHLKCGSLLGAVKIAVDSGLSLFCDFDVSDDLIDGLLFDEDAV